MTEVEFEAWLVECPEERWRVESNLPSGQIVRGSPFGDTTTSKTRKIVEEIKNSGNWNITYHTNNRNGELIAYKI